MGFAALHVLFDGCILQQCSLLVHPGKCRKPALKQHTYLFQTSRLALFSLTTCILHIPSISWLIRCSMASRCASLFTVCIITTWLASKPCAVRDINNAA
jgi:hypothetical protein